MGVDVVYNKITGFFHADFLSYYGMGKAVKIASVQG
jgi:hypothetical protein